MWPPGYHHSLPNAMSFGLGKLHVVRFQHVYQQICFKYSWHNDGFIDGLMQERPNYIVNALELHLSCTNLSIFAMINSVIIILDKVLSSVIKEYSNIIESTPTEWCSAENLFLFRRAHAPLYEIKCTMIEKFEFHGINRPLNVTLHHIRTEFDDIHSYEHQGPGSI